jgi:GTP diphosphokinase / guanosine-3',5'-bis(diphosphate) 3'-diphosphatase
MAVEGTLPQTSQEIKSEQFFTSAYFSNDSKTITYQGGTMNNYEFTIFLSALEFAAEKHRYANRKDHPQGQEHGTAYINHPIQAAGLLWNTGLVKDINILAAALLHDVLEDTPTKDNEIETRFGSKILGVVKEVSDDKSLPKEVRKRIQVETAAKKSFEAKTVKLADKITNVRDIRLTPPNWDKDRKLDYVKWSKEVVDQIRGTNLALENKFEEEFSLTLAAIENQ